MLFRLTYLLFLLPMAIGNKVLLFPNFQRSFGFTATRFFERSAKVRAILLLPKFISKNFEFFGYEIQFVL